MDDVYKTHLLKRIKTAIRSSMTTERLTGLSLSLLQIHHDVPVYLEVAILLELNSALCNSWQFMVSKIWLSDNLRVSKTYIRLMEVRGVLEHPEHPSGNATAL